MKAGGVPAPQSQREKQHRIMVPRLQKQVEKKGKSQPRPQASPLVLLHKAVISLTIHDSARLDENVCLLFLNPRLGDDLPQYGPTPR